MPVVFPKVVKKITGSIIASLHCLPNIVNTQSVCDEFNKTAIVRCRQDFVWLQPALQVLAGEDLLH